MNFQFNQYHYHYLKKGILFNFICIINIIVCYFNENLFK